ncbi:acyltransferase [Staphylococcus hyicus]|uniref:acyltransferase n=1 Tax=Staphylococcus hyicus TaxID=1284 RepID=UPI00211B9FCA|nr:acyltransferase [Staphylococcus hyicus]MCQ9307796.1 acyltransferase [Staphylococcus hyicus]
MARRVKVIATKGKYNQLWYLYRYISFAKLFKNTLIIEFLRYFPFIQLKPMLYRRLLHMKIGNHTAIAFKVVPDLMYPEKIKIGENVTIGYHTTILTHEFLPNVLRVGDVEIGNDTLIGANVTILPGVKIGERVQIGANAVVSKDIPNDTIAIGNPIQIKPL